MKWSRVGTDRLHLVWVELLLLSEKNSKGSLIVSERLIES